MKRSHYFFTLLLSLTTFPLLTEAVAQQPADAYDTDIAIDSLGLEMADSIQRLEEFTVVERQKLVQSDGAKLTYNVTEDPESGSSNILDILRKVPGVTVDAEDNVKVNGQSSFKILMNGHEDPMLKGDIKTVLKSIPAASIKRIEVISEPGAKYEAEGVGGVLNIVTDRSSTLSGFMTQFGAWINSSSAGGYLNARTKVNKVMLDANISYNNGRLWKRRSTAKGDIEDLTGSDNHLQHTDTEANNYWDYTGVNMSMSWEPDTLNLFTASLYYGNNNWGNDGEEIRTMYGLDMNQLWRLNRHIKSIGLYNSLGLETSFQHNFGRDDHNMVLSYEYDYGHNKNRSEYTVDSEGGSINEPPFSSVRARGNSKSHIIQFDYSNRFTPRHLLEAGAKVNLNDDGSLSTPLYGPSPDAGVINQDQVVNITQIKDIYALYGSYSGTYAKWNVKGGLRYEHTRMGVKYKIGDYPDFMTHLNDLVPNAALSYNITAASSLRMAYQMRISRPYLGQINPYVNTLRPGQISYGNPDLKSQKSHNISLAYSNYENRLTGSAKIFYRYVGNQVNDVIFMKDGIMNSTYANVGISHAGGFDISADWNIIKDLRWSVFLSSNYVYLKADSELLKAKNHGWQTYFNSNLNYTLPCLIRISAYGGVYTPWIDLQGRGMENGYYYGLGLSRSWLKDDALTVQLSANNILPTHRTSSYVQNDETVHMTYESRYRQWNVGLSVRFKFGGLSANVKRTAASIEKEQSSGSSSKGN